MTSSTSATRTSGPNTLAPGGPRAPNPTNDQGISLRGPNRVVCYGSQSKIRIARFLRDSHVPAR